MANRSITVQFYLATPTGADDWPEGIYPFDDVCDRIMDLEPERRLINMGTLHDHRTSKVVGPSGARMLDVSNVEYGKHMDFAQRGELLVHEWPDDAGPAEPTYAMQLEDNIFGLVRLTGGPPSEGVAAYMGIVGNVDLHLVPIESDEVRSQLAKPAGAFKHLRLTTARANADRIADASGPLGAIFQAAVEASPMVDEITVILSVRRSSKGQRDRWWGTTRREVDELLDDPEALQLFDEASLGAEGGGVNLLRELITQSQTVPVETSKHVNASVVGMAILDAYKQNRNRLSHALGRA